MESATTAQEFVDLYGQTWQHFYNRSSPREKAFTPQGLAVLTHMAQAGPITVSEAAQHFDRSQSATSELLARLIDRGVLESRADESDRRRHLIWLTPDGQRTITEQLSPLSVEALSASLEKMPPADRADLVRLLKQLVEAATPQPINTDQG